MLDNLSTHKTPKVQSRAAIHTRTTLVPRIIERPDDEHPYEVPGVFAPPNRRDEPGLPRLDS